MQVLTNQQFIATRTKIGNIGVALGVIAWLGCVFVAFNTELVAIGYLALGYGFLAFNIGRYHTLRFGGRPRQDELLTNSLRGLDQKYVLFNYVDGLPGSHLLLSPFGLFFIELRLHDGKMSCQGDRWRVKKSFTSIFRGFIKGRFGNPTKDALLGVNSVKKYLSEKLGSDVAKDIPVEAVILMTDPFAEVKVTDPIVPVVTLDDLRAQVRSLQGRTKLNNDVYRRLYDLLGASRARSVKEIESRERKKK